MSEERQFAEQKESFLKKFEECRPALSAVGDTVRQQIIKTLIEHTGEGGLRVGNIQQETNLSRTAVSHHLKVLKEAGIIDMRSEGTKNYYYLDSESSSLRLVISFWQEAENVMTSYHRRLTVQEGKGISEVQNERKKKE